MLVQLAQPNTRTIIYPAERYPPHKSPASHIIPNSSRHTAAHCLYPSHPRPASVGLPVQPRARHRRTSPPPTPNSATSSSASAPSPCASRAQSPFEALVESIVYQQLNGKAAAPSTAASSPRLRAPCGLGAHPIAPAAPRLPQRAAPRRRPLAEQSSRSRDLAAKTIDGTVPTLTPIRRMSDEDIIEHLTQVRGIGRWTVEMFLIFRLSRPDIFPLTNSASAKVRPHLGPQAHQQSHARPPRKTRRDGTPRKKMVALASLQSWYMWRACDLANGKDAARRKEE